MGFDGVSLRDIAQEANVNHAIIRYHYGSKEELWNAVFQYLLNDLIELRKTRPFNIVADDLKEEFRSFTRSRITHFANHPYLLKILFLEIIEGTTKFEMMDGIMKHFYKESMVLLKEMQSAGLGTHLDLKNLYFILPHVLGGRFLFTNFLDDFDGERKYIEEVIDAHTDLVVSLILK